MDFQTYKTHIVLHILEMKTELLNDSYKDYLSLSKTVKSFLNEIGPGSRILIEQPLIVRKRSLGGPSSYNIEITNLETMKTLKMRVTSFMDQVAHFIKKAEEINI